MGAEGVNVNAIAPGYIATDNTEALRNDKDRYKAILERIPQGRWGTPEDFAGPRRVSRVVGVGLCERRNPDGGWRLDGTLAAESLRNFREVATIRVSGSAPGRQPDAAADCR